MKKKNIITLQENKNMREIKTNIFGVIYVVNILNNTTLTLFYSMSLKSLLEEVFLIRKQRN
jgi:hypothetical protein